MDTKQLIKVTFRNILEERPLSQVTVKDIVGRAGINRNSFYYHYADLPTLIEDVVCEDAEHIFAGNENIESLEECLNVAAEFALANKKLVMHLYTTGNRDIFEQYFLRILDHLVRKYLTKLCKGNNVSAEDLEILIKYYKCLLFGLIVDWLSAGMSSDIKYDLSRLFKIYSGIPEEIVKRVSPQR